MDKLAPKLIRRAAKKDYIAIIIDPIYKVITGDENSADQMAAFCNQFDKICTELGTAVIYCHHHSKGAQGGKRSMDRASGSGVFARDPDALLDLIELDVTPELMAQQESAMVCNTCIRYLNSLFDDWEDDVSQDDMLSYVQMLAYCKKKLSAGQYSTLNALVEAAAKKVKALTAWRIDGTLREFPKFAPVNLWFDYPVHRPDKSGVLKDILPDAEKAPWQRGADKNKKNAKERKSERKKAFEMALEASNFGESPSITDLANYLGISERTARDRVKEFGGYVIEDGYVKKSDCGEDINSDIPAKDDKCGEN